MPSVPFPSTPTSHAQSSTPTSTLTASSITHQRTPSLPSHPAPSPSHPQSPRAHPKNYHPYLIQSTSSSLLTRSNSSPSQPLHSLTGHRPSRSMSSLSHAAVESFSEREDVHTGDVGSRGEDGRRRSMESPREKPVLSRSGTLPSFLGVGAKQGAEQPREVDLPLNPKQWTPSELAKYLVLTLRTGGPNGSGQTLPTPLVKDIETWVLRQQVSGRAFLRGNAENWTSSSRPPPFMPLLLSISRRLRRSSLQGRVLGTFDISSSAHDAEDGMGPDSVLLEEDEGFPDDGITGVRRLAHAFESGSASESERDDVSVGGHVTPLKPQWTGESDRSAVWRRWEAQMDTGIGKGRRRRESALSQGGMADSEASPRLDERNLSGGSGVSGEEELLDTPVDEELGGTVKGLPKGMAKLSGDIQEGEGESENSPPPPYASPNPDSGSASPATFAGVLDDTSAIHTPPARERFSVTPTPERPAHISIPGLQLFSATSDTAGDATNGVNSPGSPHMSNMLSHQITGTNPYAALRRSSSSNPAQGARLPTMASMHQHPEARAAEDENASEESDESAEPSAGARAWEGTSRWSTARRVTLRPTHVNAVFTLPTEAQGPSEREKEMESKMEKLLGRINELESRLSSVEATRAKDPVPPTATCLTSPASPTAPKQSTSPVVAVLPDSVPHSFGLIPPDDGLPTRVRELPAYLFLVGVGVGAVMVRLLLGRK